ncbi:tail fiber domain-containing protein [Methylobacterium sp. NEAU 140]|uniref:tail fiber domain-containing protein n=1 Tax=Methylobacterium sp. NEAU 140 TaxID=3064945 RepID=UPI002733532D|nr:tail fiber domain-containing protein [Methylobacterium sp. NEAU 140]MDP4026617.1 tail fiber domain-containing protein [Methylobacterium sp. NEAU 140]
MMEQKLIDSLFSNLEVQTLQNLKSYVIGYITGSAATAVFYGTLESWKRHRTKKSTSAALKNDEAGSIFLTLFAAVAVLGVLASGVNMVMRGPVTTMADVTKRTIAENNIIAASKLAIMSASAQANNGDCDSDGYIEPIAYRDAGASTKPAGGGYLPSTIGATQTDPWQSQYGYCVWDAGPQTVSNNVAGCGGSSAKRLNGAPTGTQYVVAVISAGKDKTFQTACNAYVDANNDGQPDMPLVNKPAGSDDVSIGYTYAEANALGGSLWALKSGTPSVATIAKDLEVTGGASFSGSLRLGKGLILPSDPGDNSLTGPCNAANDQQIRINKATTPPKMEICNFAGGSTLWQSMSGGSAAGIQGSVQYNNGGAFAGDSKLIYDGTNLYSGGQFITSGSGAAFVGNDRGDNTKAMALYRASNQTRIWDSTGGDRITIDNNSGNIGIGGSPGGYKLQVAGDILAGSWLRSLGNTGWYNETYGGGWYMADTTWLRAYGDKNIYTPNTMLAGYMQANNMYAPGNVTAYSMTANAINSNAPGDGYRIAVDATNASGVYGAAIRAYSTSTGYYCFLGSANGAITCNGPAYGTSDARLKKDIHPLQQKEGLDAIMAIKPVRYLWKDDRKNKNHPNGEIGFIAQNVEKVLPDMVAEFIEQKPEEVSATPDLATKGAGAETAPVLKPIDPKLDKNGDPVDPRLFKHKSLTYDRMVVPVVLAIQQLKHQLDGLRQEIMALFDRHADEIAKLTARLDAVEAENRTLRERLDDMEAMQDECVACSL